MKRGRIEIIRKETNVINGRRQQDETSFYECWCEVQSLNTAEKYEALQRGLEDTIVFKVRHCRKMEEIRIHLKEFYAVYKETEFKIYDATPMYTDNNRVLLKCRAVA